MKVIEIEVSKLKLDTPFNYSFFPEEEFSFLKESIKRLGVLSPIFIFKEEKEFIPFSGFKRIFFSNENDNIPAIIFDERDPAELFKISIFENISHRTLNYVEITKIIKSLISFGIVEDKLYGEFFPFLGLNANKVDLNFFENIFLLNLDCKKYIARGDFSVKSLKILFKFPRDIRSTIFLLSKRLCLNKNREVIFLNHLFELWKKGEEIGMVFKRVEEFLKEDIPLPQRADKVLNYLESKNFPLQFSYRKKFYKFLKEFNCPGDVKVFYPRSFEERKLRMEINLTPENLKDVIVFLKEMKDNNFFKGMSELI